MCLLSVQSLLRFLRTRAKRGREARFLQRSGFKAAQTLYSPPSFSPQEKCLRDNRSKEVLETIGKAPRSSSFEGQSARQREVRPKAMLASSAPFLESV